MVSNALIVLVKYPRPGLVKTRLMSILDETAICRISELFLVDLLARFVGNP